jgi:hypothetical protein
MILIDSSVRQVVDSSLTNQQGGAWGGGWVGAHPGLATILPGAPAEAAACVIHVDQVIGGFESHA